MNKLTPILASLILAFGVSGGAIAQSAPQQPAPATATGTPKAADFSDEDVQKFAEVQPVIEGIRQEYSQRLLEVNDPEKAARLQNEAVQEMVEKVNEIGLEVGIYNGIAVALQSDPDLRTRIESMMN